MIPYPAAGSPGAVRPAPGFFSMIVMPIEAASRQPAVILHERLVPDSVRRQAAGMTAPLTLAQQQKHIDELRARLGDEHPDVLAAMLDLSEMLWARGRLA